MPYHLHHEYPKFKFRKTGKEPNGDTVYTASWHEDGYHEEPRLLVGVYGNAGEWYIPMGENRFLGRTFKTREEACLAWLEVARWKVGFKANEEWLEEFRRGSTPRPPEPMSLEAANAVYDILVEECDAPNRDLSRESFIYFYTEKWGGDGSEWRFEGCLLFGGKFRTYRYRWAVDGYPEDMTPYRKLRASSANVRLGQLWIKLHGHNTLPPYEDSP